MIKRDSSWSFCTSVSGTVDLGAARVINTTVFRQRLPVSRTIRIAPELLVDKRAAS